MATLGLMQYGGQQLGDIPAGTTTTYYGQYSSIPGTQLDATTAGNLARGYSDYGLNVARNLYDAQQMQYREGTTYPGQAASYAPEQTNYYEYTPTAPIQQIQAPNYQYTAGNAPSYQNQFMGGDYEAYQKALATSGELAAQRAYSEGTDQLSAIMGGRGLYGSNMMGSSLADLNSQYQQNLATNAANAAIQRYQAQAADIAAQNTFAQNLYGQKLGQEQNINQFGLSAADMLRNQAYDTWRANAAETANVNQFNQGQMNWQQQYLDAVNSWKNQQAQEAYNYQLAQQAWKQSQDEAMINRALAIAGQGAPLSSAATQYQTAMQQLAAQQQIAAQANATKTTGNYLSALGGLTGSAIANPNSISSLYGFLSGGASQLGQLFGSGNNYNDYYGGNSAQTWSEGY